MITKARIAAARLLAALLWVLCATAAAQTDAMGAGGTGYLGPDLPSGIKQWLPPAPAVHTAAEREDVAMFRATRKTLATARGQQAAEDDVFDPPLVAARFSEAAGVPLDAATAPTLMKLIGKMQADAGRLVAPVKLAVADGGRKRPFVQFPRNPTCLTPRDMAGHAHDDLVTFHLADTGSYPSTHSLVGQFIGMVLAEVLPARADALMARGLEFGNSRIICGFHYYSDVVGGRMAGAYLFARLHAEPAFNDDMNTLRKELQAAGAR